MAHASQTSYSPLRIRTAELKASGAVASNEMRDADNLPIFQIQNNNNDEWLAVQVITRGMNASVVDLTSIAIGLAVF